MLLGAGGDSQRSTWPPDRLYPPQHGGVHWCRAIQWEEFTMALAVVEGTLWLSIWECIMSGSSPQPLGLVWWLWFMQWQPLLQGHLGSVSIVSLADWIQYCSLRAVPFAGAGTASIQIIGGAVSNVTFSGAAPIREGHDREVQTRGAPKSWRCAGTWMVQRRNLGSTKEKIKKLYPARTSATTRLGLTIGEMHTYGRSLSPQPANTPGHVAYAGQHVCSTISTAGQHWQGRCWPCQSGGPWGNSSVTQEPSFSLIADDWMHPPWPSWVGCAGVYMPPSQEETTPWAQSSSYPIWTFGHMGTSSAQDARTPKSLFRVSSQSSKAGSVTFATMNAHPANEMLIICERSEFRARTHPNCLRCLHCLFLAQVCDQFVAQEEMDGRRVNC